MCHNPGTAWETVCLVVFFFLQAEDGIRDAQESRGLEDVYKRQYLNTLSPSGRRSQHTALNNLAYIFSGGEMNEALNFPWELLRYEHTSGLAAYMVDIGYAKSSVNKHLVALRPVSYTHLTLPTI